MSYENLTRVTELSVAFKNAIEAGMQDSAEKFMASLRPGEMESIQEQLQDVLAETMKLAFGGKPSEAFLKKNIALVELTADVALRVVPEQDVAAYVPAGLKNEEDVKLLRDVGAPKLASLCAFKPK